MKGGASWVRGTESPPAVEPVTETDLQRNSMKTFFSVAAVLTMLLGIGWLLFPGAMLSSWGV